METNIHHIPLNEIEIMTNIRVMEHDSIKELAQSIKENGLIQPITVMVNSNKTPIYRLITGHRRFEAYKLNGEELIPAIVKPKMDEKDIHTLQIVENIQRETVSIIEESKAFESMKHDLHLNAKQIARMIGKSAKYVETRMMLANLIPQISLLVHTGKLTLQHATLFAQCVPDMQEKLLQRLEDHGAPGTYEGARELKRYIKNSVVHPLGTAPFDFEDENLFPEAGSCLKCPKRSGAHKNLFETIDSEDDCFDPDCYFKKIQAFMEQIRAQYKDQGVKVHFLTEHWYPEVELKKKGWEFAAVQKTFDMPKGKPMKGYPLKAVGIWIEANDPQKNGTAVQILTKEQYQKFSESEGSDINSKIDTALANLSAPDEFQKFRDHAQKYIRTVINDIALAVSKADDVKIPDAMLRMIGHDLLNGLDDEDMRSFLKNFQWVCDIPGANETDPVLTVNYENATYIHLDPLYQANIYRYTGRDLNELIIYLMLLELGSRSVNTRHINSDFIYAVEMAKELKVDTEITMMNIENEAGIELQKYFVLRK